MYFCISLLILIDTSLWLKENMFILPDRSWLSNKWVYFCPDTRWFSWDQEFGELIMFRVLYPIILNHIQLKVYYYLVFSDRRCGCDFSTSQCYISNAWDPINNQQQGNKVPVLPRNNRSLHLNQPNVLQVKTMYSKFKLFLSIIFWSSSQFKSFAYLYNEDQFVFSLAKDVKVVRTLPKYLKGARRKKEIPLFKVPHSASPFYYLHHVLPVLKKHSVVELVVSNGGCLQVRTASFIISITCFDLSFSLPEFKFRGEFVRNFFLFFNGID